MEARTKESLQAQDSNQNWSFYLIFLLHHELLNRSKETLKAQVKQGERYKDYMEFSPL